MLNHMEFLRFCLIVVKVINACFLKSVYSISWKKMVQFLLISLVLSTPQPIP